MYDVFVSKFVELSSLSRKLNQASDRVNSAIAGINSELGRLNLGLEVWLAARPIRLNEQEEICIGYCEIEGEWQLALRRRICDSGPIDDAQEEEINQDFRPLLKASRGLRLDALSLVPKLLDEIKRRGESLLEEIAEAEKSAEKL